MDIQQAGKVVSGAVTGLGEIVQLGKESPDAREAGRYAAKSLKIVAQTVHTVLLPLAAANYGAQRFERYMRTKFGDELGERLSAVPPDDITEPRPVVAGPVLDALVYAHEEDDLRGLYLSLLATAMDARNSSSAHPGFTDVLKQLDALEVPYLREVLTAGIGSWPVVRFERTIADTKGALIVLNHVLDWRDGVHSAFNPMTAAYVDNWIRLGLIEVSYSTYLTADTAYNWVESRVDYLNYKETFEATEGVTLSYERGVVRLTEWGKGFAKAIGLSEVPAGASTQVLGDWSPSVTETRTGVVTVTESSP